MQYRLRVYSPGYQGKQDFVLPVGELVVGRNPARTPNLQMTHAYLLDTHLAFHTDADQATVTLGAAATPVHETLLNGKPLRPNRPAALKDGDQLLIRNLDATDQIITFFVECFGQTPVGSALAPTPNGELCPVPIGLRCQSVRLLPLLPAIYQPDRPLLCCDGQSTGAAVGAMPADADGTPSLCRTCGRAKPADLTLDSFLSRYLALVESMLLPVSATVANFDLFLNPLTAPETFLPWLAGWIELEAGWSVAQQRALLATFAWRGTKLGLTRLLECYTGHRPTIIDEEATLPPHTFRVVLPVALAELATKTISEASLRRLIDLYKPAHTTYLLEFDSTLCGAPGN